jgi:hypothetical protein
MFDRFTDQHDLGIGEAIEHLAKRRAVLGRQWFGVVTQDIGDVGARFGATTAQALQQISGWAVHGSWPHQYLVYRYDSG